MPVNNTSPSQLHIVSHNVQGHNFPVKRKKLFKLYQSQKLDVPLLQETHFPMSYNLSFIHQHFPQFYFSNVENKTKVVVICVSKHLNFSMSQVTRDPSGRYILVNGTLYSLVSVYTPNSAQAKFFASILHFLEQQLEGIIILGENSNVAFDLSLNKSDSGGPAPDGPLNKT